jgi:hypothetical protein
LERIVYQESWHGNGVTAMQLLVERGANLHAKYSNGATLLHFVRNEEMLDYLLSQKFDINVPDNQGKTPYYYAVSEYGKYTPRATRLEKRGSNINAGPSTTLANSAYEERSKSQDAEAKIYRERQAKKQAEIEAVQAKEARDFQRAQQAMQGYRDQVDKDKATLDAIEADRQRRTSGGQNCIANAMLPGCR